MSHNPYFSRWFSAMQDKELFKLLLVEVTILILVDGFLQSRKVALFFKDVCCHNPYFSRWFSAIQLHILIILMNYCHNPYFSRWFSAIQTNILITMLK